jgi:hypothetical protein
LDRRGDRIDHRLDRRAWYHRPGRRP